jgi:hypothetical protein
MLHIFVWGLAVPIRRRRLRRLLVLRPAGLKIPCTRLKMLALIGDTIAYVLERSDNTERRGRRYRAEHKIT